MNLYTLYAGQGDFAVLRVGDGVQGISGAQPECFIIDTHLPDPADNVMVRHVVRCASEPSAAWIRGIVLTGYDKDHADPQGLGMILKRYTHIEWILRPRYTHNTANYSAVEECIRTFQAIRQRVDPGRPLKDWPVVLESNKHSVFTGMSNHVDFYLLGPHEDQMTSSNNSSVVLKIVPKGHLAAGFSFLVTGDAERARWQRIVDSLGHLLPSEVLSAPHHGALSGFDLDAMAAIEPRHVIISCGHANQYNHGNSSMRRRFERLGATVYSTRAKVNLHTRRDALGRLITKEF